MLQLFVSGKRHITECFGCLCVVFVERHICLCLLVSATLPVITIIFVEFENTFMLAATLLGYLPILPLWFAH